MRGNGTHTNKERCAELVIKDLRKSMEISEDDKGFRSRGIKEGVILLRFRVMADKQI
ncbi:hypothetical protein [Neobacillus niacini]|uniref:hypothetical protein n=1 Tax=Neobacillus niacini TaxID=86668 RepID=UPI00286A72EA|nr:hypothetical protein [Neobacillus niacini]